MHHRPFIVRDHYLVDAEGGSQIDAPVRVLTPAEGIAALRALHDAMAADQALRQPARWVPAAAPSRAQP